MPSPASDTEASLLVGTPEQFGWLQGIVKAVLVLNLLDAIFTLVWVRAGLALEANLLIDRLVEHHALTFFGVKLGLVGMGSWLLWSWRERPFAVIAIFVSFLTYYWVLLYHLQYLSGLMHHVLTGT